MKRDLVLPNSLNLQDYSRFQDQTRDEKPLSEERSIGYQERVWKDVKLAWFQLWPAAFYGMFGYDLYHYFAHPDDRYQVDGLALTFGVSRNYHPQHASLSTNLGRDIPTYGNNFWWWTLVIASPIAAEIVLLLKVKIRNHLQRGGSFPNWFKLNKLRYKLIEAKVEEGKDHKTDPAFGGPTAMRKVMPQSNALDRKITEQFDELTRIEESNCFYRLLAIDVWAQVYHAHRHDRMGEVIHDDIRPRAFAEQGSLIKLYEQYQFWYFDETKPVSSWIKGSFYVFWYGIPWARLAVLVIQKLIQVGEFRASLKDCHDQGKHWRFIPEIGNYDCTVCDDSVYRVDYRSSESGPGCLAALTAEPHDAGEILTEFKSLTGFGPFNDSSLDFSRQSWPTWPVSTWQEIMALLPDFKYPSALNCSAQTLSYFWVPPDMLSPIADYLKDSPVSREDFKVDFSRQWINAQGMTVLVSGLQNNTRITELRLAQCGLSDSILEVLLPILPTMTTLTTLDLSGNALTGYSITLLNAILPNTTIISLNLAGNELATADIEQFEVDETPLQWLEIAGTDLSQGTAVNFAARTMRSQLIYLGLGNCQIPDTQVIAMFPNISHSGIRTLDYSYNQISFDGMQVIAEYTPDSLITDLNLANNAFNDAALALLTEIIGTKNCPLIRLVLSGNRFTAAGLQDFILTLNTSALQTLELAHIQSGDDIVAAFTLVPAQSLPLVQLDLSWTKMTAQGAKQFFNYQINSSLTWLDLSHNVLAGDLSSALFSGLTAGKLQQLFLRATQSDAESIQAACQALPDSKLEVFDISENNLGDSVAINCSKNLITPYEDFWFGSLAQNYDKSRVVTQAKKHTNIRCFIFQQDQSITAIGAEALCSVAPPAQIQNQDLLVSSSTPGNMSTGIPGCPISDGFPVVTSSAQREHTASWLLIATIMCLVLRNNPILIILYAVGQGLQKTTETVSKGCTSVRQLSAVCRKTGIYSDEAKTTVKTEPLVSAGRYQR